MHSSIFVTATSIEQQCVLIVEHAPTSVTLAAVTRDRAAAVLGAAAPVIAYAEREGDGVLVSPLTPDGDRLARLLAAQLTLCAAGLWPGSELADRLADRLAAARDAWRETREAMHIMHRHSPYESEAAQICRDTLDEREPDWTGAAT